MHGADPVMPSSPGGNELSDPIHGHCLGNDVVLAAAIIPAIAPVNTKTLFLSVCSLCRFAYLPIWIYQGVSLPVYPFVCLYSLSVCLSAYLDLPVC